MPTLFMWDAPREMKLEPMLFDNGKPRSLTKFRRRKSGRILAQSFSEAKLLNHFHAEKMPFVLSFFRSKQFYPNQFLNEETLCPNQQCPNQQ